jgi:hypothetical protein
MLAIVIVMSAAIYVVVLTFVFPGSWHWLVTTGVLGLIWIVAIALRRIAIRREAMNDVSTRDRFLELDRDLLERAKHALNDGSVFVVRRRHDQQEVGQLGFVPIVESLLREFSKVETCDMQTCIDVGLLGRGSDTDRLRLIGYDDEGTRYYIRRPDGAIFGSVAGSDKPSAEAGPDYRSLLNWIVCIHGVYSSASGG